MVYDRELIYRDCLLHHNSDQNNYGHTLSLLLFLNMYTHTDIHRDWTALFRFIPAPGDARCHKDCQIARELIAMLFGADSAWYSDLKGQGHQMRGLKVKVISMRGLGSL